MDFLGRLFVILDVQLKIFVIMWTSFLDVHLCLLVLCCIDSLIITSSSYITIWKKETLIDVWIPKFIKWNGLFSSEMKNGGVCATYIYICCVPKISILRIIASSLTSDLWQSTLVSGENALEYSILPLCIIAAVIILLQFLLTLLLGLLYL